MKFLFAPIVFVLLTSSLCAEAAVFREVKGKVEYQLQGDDWMPAKIGVSIPAGTMVSTGFKSTTSLEILGSVIVVKPLTRMLLEELLRTSGGTTTNLTLLSGKVKAEVKPSSTTSLTTFNVKSPTATASVRGTGFEFDGENLLVNHGNVEFSNQWHISRSVQGGEFSSTGRGAGVTPPIPVKPAEKPLITAAGGAEEVDAMFKDSTPVPAPEASPAPVAPAVPGAETPAADSGTAEPEASTQPEAPAPAEAPSAAPPVEIPTVDLTSVINTYGNELLLDAKILTVADEVKKAKTDVLQTVVQTNTLNVTVK